MAGSYNTTGYRNGDGVLVTQGQTAVTQATSITTGVTCNSYSGVITTVSQTVAGGAEAEFTVTNNKVAATDVVVATIKTHTSAGTFTVHTSATAAGSFNLQLTNLATATAGNNVLVINFVVLKAEA
jgi:hypothetical protein